MTLPIPRHSMRCPRSSRLPVLISIHDVMPETLQEVERIVAVLNRRRINRATLLVVPGKPWKDQDVEVLRSFEAAGFDLAGHGWHHRCPQPQSLRHRLHSRLVSRSVAEHFALSQEDIIHLLTRCHDWFARHGLVEPALYVPPAWAMGSVSRSDLSNLPYRFYETLCGLFDTRKQEFFPLPLCGFEADTVFRKYLLRGLNRANLWWAGFQHLALRVAIHPYDCQHRLSRDLFALLSDAFEPMAYGDVGR